MKRDWQPIATAPRDRAFVGRAGKRERATWHLRGKWVHSRDPWNDWIAVEWQPDEWDAASVKAKGA